MSEQADVSNHVDEIMVESGSLSQFEESVNLVIKIAEGKFVDGLSLVHNPDIECESDSYKEDIRFMMQKQYIMGYLNSMHYLMHDIKNIVNSKMSLTKAEREVYNKILSKISILINRI